MKRLILLLGIGWALIYVINHMLLPSMPLNTKTEVATAPEPISTDRRIDSWGAYLPNWGPCPMRIRQRGLPTFASLER
jgi:hypothetical protein